MEGISNISPAEKIEKINLKILYAEDNASVRSFLLMLLKERYSMVDSVSDGQQLMEKLTAPGAGYDCVLTDNSMPRKTGLQALKEIRGMEKLKNIPVIVLTGDIIEIEDEVKELGAICIGKPPIEDELFKEIERVAKAR